MRNTHPQSNFNAAMATQLVFQQSASRQRGAALVVGLIMLLLLTLVGVAGMKDTLLQQKMVASAKDREVALQAAESALRFVTTDLTGISPKTMTNGGGLYKLGTPIANSLLNRTSTETAFWNNWNWPNNSVAYGYALDGVADGNPPRYVVEELTLDGYGTSNGGTGGAGGSGGIVSAADFIGEPAIVAGAGFEAKVYRVTVRAVGSTPDSVVLLQGTVRRVDPKL